MKVNMMHGAGGEVMAELLQTLTKFKHNNAGGIGLEAMDDGAVIPLNGENVVFTTDSHIVRPIFFPGGDIGRIAICGTINDLAMMGGKPLALSCGMIIEEGFEIDDLARIVASMDDALGEAGANLVTGDTKVMEKGAIDGIAINTSGIGIAKKVVRDNGLMPGDMIIVSGTIGDHGLAIMAHREGFDLGEQIKSDVAPLWGMVEKVLEAGPIHAMKDPTRGGFASAINEMARKSRVSVRIQEEKLPIRKSVGYSPILATKNIVFVE
jgi:hydrogenase expression/formation protein HypE